MKRFRYRPLTALLTFGAICGIGTSVGGGNEAYAADTPDVGLSQQALDIGDLAAMCGYVCPGGKDGKGNAIATIAEGNASVSGVASIDAFFSSVVNYQLAAKSVAAGINTELEGIRADFGLGAGADVGALLQAKLDASLEAGFSLKVEPAKCKADFKAELEAAARCDAQVTPGKVQVECKGGCDVDVKAAVMCDASAELRCTVQAPEIACNGECTGTCSVDLSASGSCNGTCNGECGGECSAYVMDTSGKAKCAGKCSGMCTGSCDIEVAADASCKGKCRGECTLTKEPSAGCEGGIRAQCHAKGSASIKCDTKCDGEFMPPMVKAECEARVHADAQLNVQCTPPRVAFNYILKANLKVEERLRLELALKSLVSVRLPALKAALARGKLVTEAGATLGGAAGDAIVGAAKVSATGNAKALFGLGCATEQMKLVPGIITSSGEALKASVSSAAKVESALKI
jgi:hypothetical protein